MCKKKNKSKKLIKEVTKALLRTKLNMNKEKIKKKKQNAERKT